MIYCIFLWNNSIYIIVRNCGFGTVLGVLNKCSDLWSWDTLSSWWLDWHRHARIAKQFFVKSYNFSYQSVTIVLTYTLVLNKRNTLWLRHMVRQTSLMMSAARADLWLVQRLLPSLGLCAWPYCITTTYSYCMQQEHLWWKCMLVRPWGCSEWQVSVFTKNATPKAQTSKNSFGLRVPQVGLDLFNNDRRPSGHISHPDLTASLRPSVADRWLKQVSMVRCFMWRPLFAI